MQIYNTSNTPSLGRTMTTALEQLGIECPASQVISPVSSDSALNSRPTNELSVVFCAGPDFVADELRLLKDLCGRELSNDKTIAVGSNFSPTALAYRLMGVECEPSKPTWARRQLCRLKAMSSLFLLIGP
jgi:hypothetical protein